MIDTHAHIVYGVDDGAIDMDMSLAMLREACGQGVRAIVCTSHSSIDMERYHTNFAALRSRAAEEDIPVALYPGCEVACGRLWMDIILRQIREGYLPMMNGSDCIMAEFASYMRSEEILHCVERLQREAGVQVMIAHAERYRALQEDAAAVNGLTEMGALLQVNAWSLAEEEDEAVRSLAQRLVAERRAVLLGSDAHRLTHRPPRVKAGIAYIRQHCDAEYAEDLLWRNAQRLFGCKYAPHCLTGR